MKKGIRIILIVAILGALVGLFNKNYKDQNPIEVRNSKLQCEVKYKGLRDAVDFAMDEKNNYYIACKNKVQYIDAYGKSDVLFKDRTLNITSMEYYKEKLYYASGTKIYCYDIKKKEAKVLLYDLPNFGDYKETILRVIKDTLFITVGAVTNSGVVGEDNLWYKDTPYSHDVSPKTITIKGKNFGGDKTGAFTPYKTKNIGGQIIPSHFPGNSSLIVYSLTNGWMDTFAWGIRNIQGIDFNSEERIFAAIGGMENRGLRPIKGDMDYIYEIKKDQWYGWPDYSGGDPVNSPKFKGNAENRELFILDKHPTTNPPAPLYQHNSLSSLGKLAIDSKGAIGERDLFYCYDEKQNKIFSLSKNGVVEDVLGFCEGSRICSIKFANASMIFLDKEKGFLCTVDKVRGKEMVMENRGVLYIFMGMILVGILYTLGKIR